MSLRERETGLETLKRLRSRVANRDRSVSAEPVRPDPAAELTRLDKAIAEIEAGGGVQDA